MALPTVLANLAVLPRVAVLFQAAMTVIRNACFETGLTALLSMRSYPGIRHRPHPEVRSAVKPRRMNHQAPLRGRPYSAATKASIFSTRAAQNLNSGILPKGSNCGLVNMLAAATSPDLYSFDYAKKRSSFF